ncbi:unnamed protein product [Lactuca saligna]|uniref:Uncharacterized protein n=1 Tax=Lactuca saligna TaxID=75948 RepID=A0AA35UX87_LACSI|nr:unnamed protein product [Lactuca saligna]
MKINGVGRYIRKILPLISMMRTSSFTTIQSILPSTTSNPDTISLSMNTAAPTTPLQHHDHLHYNHYLQLPPHSLVATNATTTFTTTIFTCHHIPSATNHNHTRATPPIPAFDSPPSITTTFKILFLISKDCIQVSTTRGCHVYIYQ